MDRVHAFLSFSGLSLAELWRIRYRFGTLHAAYEGLLGPNRDDDYGLNFSAAKLAALRAHLRRFPARSKLADLLKRGISLIDFSSPDYPEPLKHISPSPPALYVQGNRDLFRDYSRFLAMVGPRRPSVYGIQVAGAFGEYLAENGLILVSGLALGIDTIAHRSALNRGKPTIAVLGSDLLNVYPACNRHLAATITAQGGLLLSEISPSLIGQKFHFALRNRIISGLSRAVFLVEAGEKSGGLITAASAFRQNREVFTVPNSIFAADSLGSNRLLVRDLAKPVMDPLSILLDLGFRPALNATQASTRDRRRLNDPIDAEEKLLLNFIFEHANSPEAIAAHLDWPLTKTLTLLTELESRGLVQALGFGDFIGKKANFLSLVKKPPP